ncbi:type II secretion system protein GspM [Pseudoalteromonas denitrificans]|uniref:Type II secretion system (T2SS), protein M n=1 Tax=Pseudoalteromonas denitrificans DSM 6059 TaxID=1123010 RepID=A0A1I1U977_9GAMM|nr:type II secretion system protein GspM [Pseudoalteromonas denitrificans]SFD66108.1 Type II secretion system (T2SS), protein M [Pseudoalteromonas denitrificans DSM 6059]
MKEQWMVWSEKLTQLQSREKYLVLGIGLFLVLYLSIWFVLSPLHTQLANNKKQIKRQNQSLSQGKVKIDMFNHALTQDYTLQLRNEIELAKQKLQRVDQELSQFSQGFIPPYKMATVLKKLLDVNQKLSIKESAASDRV